MFLFTLIRKLISGTILLIVVISLWALGRTWFVAHDLTVRKADAIVVMGAAQLDGRPGDVLKARLKRVHAFIKKTLRHAFIRWDPVRPVIVSLKPLPERDG